MPRSVNLAEMIFLLCAQRVQVLESGRQGGRGTHAVKVFQQELNGSLREMTYRMNKMLSSAIPVLYQCVANAGLVRQVTRGIRKKCRQRVLSLNGFHKRLRRNREDGFARASGDHFIGIVGKNRKDFRAVCECKMRATGAYSKFSLARSAAVPKIFQNFRV